MEQKFLKKNNLKRFVDSLSEIYQLYYIQKGREENLHLIKYTGELEKIVIGSVRPFEPLKNFFFCTREKVVDGYEKSEKIAKKEDRPFCILGVKNCDLSGLEILDYVFMQGDFKDPFYIRNRESNLIVAADCTKAIDTCFCHALGHMHYPERYYDISMAELYDGYLVEGATEKGGEFLAKHKDLFDKASHKHAEEREHIRRHTGERVEENIRDNNIPLYTGYGGIVKENLESKIWERETETCVECGCCNVICPTCHCFYLFDMVTNNNKELRYKIWDSCMYKRFARVAGGANPRAHLWMRLRNRFEKKFDYFPQVSGFYACTGCGRCFSGCPGKIDIRRILKDLVAEKKAKVSSN